MNRSSKIARSSPTIYDFISYTSDQLKSAILILIALVAISICVAIGTYSLAEYLLNILKLGLPKEILGVLVTATATIFCFILGDICKRLLDAQQQRANKITLVYENLIDFIVDFRNATSTEEERVRQIIEIEKGIMKCGSSKVMFLWNEVVLDLPSKELSDRNLRKNLLRLLLAMRKQAGYPEE